MIDTPPLPTALETAVLTHLNVERDAPSPRLLDRLLHGYARRVPWESAFRIARRAATAEMTDCPRWPAHFWQESIEKGGGGTCFESNYAFFSLLRGLGFEGYLTINDMGESIGCHTAIIILRRGEKWLVDVGLPLYAALPVSGRGVMHRGSDLMRYTVRPDGRDRYRIERRPHPQTVAFTLIDQPVSDADYRAATTADYGPDGLFLDRVIVNKVVGGFLWRFNMGERPWRFNRFHNGERTDFELDGEPATAVARHFNMDKEIVQAAFAALADS